MIHNYFKIALRNLYRHKGFTLLNISGLAIGMTAGFLVLLYVSFELSYDNMHSKGDSIYRVVADIDTPSEKIESGVSAWPVGPNIEKEFPEILKYTRVLSENFTIVKEGTKFLEAHVIAVDSSFFEIFDFELIKGDKSQVLKRPNSLVISETIATQYFDSNNPIGQNLMIEGFDNPALITGVIKDIPKNSHIQADIIISMITYTAPPSNRDEQWGNYDPSTYVLVADGTNSKNLETKFPDFLEKRTGDEMRESKMFVTLFLEPFEEVYLKSRRGSAVSGNIGNVYTFSIIGIFILLIASINFINLATARSVERAKEVGIRKVVGADKNQLAFQFIGESIILCTIAFFVTVGLTTLALPYFNELAGKTVSIGVFAAPINILYLFLLAMTIGAIAGIYPAIVLSSFRPVSVLKGGFSTGAKGVLLRKSLVVLQFTISISLIIGTIVIYKQMQFMQNQELGFNKEHTIVIPTKAGSSQDALRISLTQIPGVKGTALASSVPGTGNTAAYSEIENQQGDLQVANLGLYFVNEDYVQQLGMEIIAGRGFSRDFASDSSKAMIINEKAVSLLGYANAQDVIGANYQQWGSNGEVIGVVRDFNFKSLQQEIGPLTMRLDPTQTDIITVKIEPNNTAQTLASIKSTWQSMMLGNPFEYYFLDELFNNQYQAEEQFEYLFLSFALLAIFISCLGLFGLTAYSTIQRKREIGIRKIIGASVSSIIKLLSKEFIKLVAIAFVISAPIAWCFMNSWLEDFAYKIDVKWWMFVLAAIGSMAIALITVSFQAITAALANPVDSLKTE